MSELTILNPETIKTSPCEGHNDTLTITEGPYEGLQFRYEWVAIDPVKGIQFDYKTLNGTVGEEDRLDFEQAISRLLAHHFKSQLESNELIFNGGSSDVTPEDMLKFMEENYGVTPNTPLVEVPEAAPKNVAQMIMQQPGVFSANQNESAMSFLERLAAQGMAAMGKKQ